MSKAAKPSSAGPSAEADLPFEEALKKLEAIVETMESDELPLETMLARYEEGTRLAQVCQARLQAVEVRIQQLEAAASGDLALKPFDPGSAEPA